MKYLILDLETQIHKSYKRKANPFDERNYIVMRGWKKQGDKRCSSEYFTSREAVRPLTDEFLSDVGIIVGHNLKFDLLHEMQYPGAREALMRFFNRGGRIWCTQYAKYLLEAQQQKYHMNSMDGIIEEYGGRTKIDQVKALWEAGVQTSEIDRNLLEDYLIGTEDEGRNSGDIGNTERIFLGEVKEAVDLGMTTALRFRMDGLAATTEMEFNGIKIDKERAAVNLKKLNAERDEVDAKLQEHIAFIPDEVGFSWGSNVHKSCIIFGGTIKYEKQTTYIDENTGELARKKATERWPLFDKTPRDPAQCEYSDKRSLYYYRNGEQIVVQDRFAGGKRKGEGKFKNVDVPGELKVKYQDFFFECPGVTKPEPEWKGKMTDGKGKPCYSVGKDVIERITKRDIPFLKDMGRLNALDKEIGTYYIRYDEKKKEHVGMLTCVMDDNIVHHSLNHTNTVTSRLSANNPNAQNFPRGDKSDLKAIFVSRFGEHGRMIEADYSQLEVVVQGLLSGDPNLIRDLINKVDFHCKRVSLKNSCSYAEAVVWCKDEEKSPDYAKWKKERTKCKIFSFQRAYGAGAALIAEETGMAKEEVEDMISKEDIEYAGVKLFNEMVEAECLSSAEFFRDSERGWRTFRRGYWQAPTGTMYTWRSYDAQAWQRAKGITDSFSPTEMKNYPVQGTGGELVQMAIGVLWRWFMKNENFGGRALLVNTVHDCIWADAHEDVKLEVCRGIKAIMESIPQLLEAFFKIKCPVPFPVDVEDGINMLDLHHTEM